MASSQVVVTSDGSQILPKDFKHHVIDMEGWCPVLLIKKSLKKKDVEHEPGRLMLPLRKINGIFLTLEELRLLGEKNGGIDVVLLDPSLNQCVLRLTRTKKGSYKLRGDDWRLVVKRNGLGVGSKVHVWMFRVESRPCFAIVKP